MGRKPIPQTINSLNDKVAKAYTAAKRELRIKFRELQVKHAAKALKSILKSHLPLAEKHKAQLVKGRFVPIGPKTMVKVIKKRGRPRKM